MFKLIQGSAPDFSKFLAFRYNGKRGKLINTVPIGFDIETTNVDESETAYMYIWQCCIDSSVYVGRTWDDFFDFLHWLRQPAILPPDKGYIHIFIHNMSFEMSFLLPQFVKRNMLKRVFAKAEWQPIEVEITGGIVFRDTMALTNMSLASLAKNYTKTQKLVYIDEETGEKISDLDYSIPRNSKTVLTARELSYCINDVVILSEYAQQLHAEYTMYRRRIPLTSTGIVRQYVKEQIPPNRRYAVQQHIASLFPETVEQYNYTMRWLFRGGFTHAQTAICGDILYNVSSFDFTSAYPSIMIHEAFPATPFEIVQNPTKSKIDSLIDAGRAVLAMVDFYGIQATCAHVVESKHKIIDYEHAIFENGRLYKAAHIRVLLTDIDYQIYHDFYKWDRCEIVSAKTAHKKRLPDYLFNAVLEFYKGKKELKAQVKAAEAAGVDASDIKKLLQKVKGMLNSCYGMTVSHLNFDEITYDADGWHEVDGESYDVLKQQQFLSPYWGIYVTAYCRRNILAAMKYYNENAAYSDTDSIKLLGNDFSFFDEYNARVRALNEDICRRRGLPVEIYGDLGLFDNEGMYFRFKAWGAKRYVYEKDGNIEAVIAGLPKSVTKSYAKENGNDALFDFFRPGMSFEDADKNRHVYHSEPVSAIVEGEEMHELGCCYITASSFKMTVEQLFISQICERKELKH